MFGHRSFLRIGALSDSSISGLYKDSYELDSCSYSFSQGGDVNGKPQAEVRGGTNDVGVGALGLMSGAASYFSGVQIPIIGEFVLLYGVMRTNWDLGEQYGPSKWPGFYQQHQECKK